MEKRCSVAIGNFDGVHTGHQKVIQNSIEFSKRLNLVSVALTFSPHPREFFRKKSLRDTSQDQKDIKRISTEKEKLELFRDLGLDAAFILRFDDRLAQTPAEEFIQNTIINQIGAEHVTTGANFMFGKNRSGDSNLIDGLSRKYRFGYTAIEPLEVSGVKCSSSEIRRSIVDGDVKDAIQMLGRPYSISGIVVKGDARGRSLGFPTANVFVHHKKVWPANGVYNVRVSGQCGVGIQAVANIGTRPTFGHNSKALEVHIPEFNGNLYDTKLKVDFLEKIRPEKKFANVDELKAQILADIHSLN